MTFHSPLFWIYLPLVAIVYYRLRAQRRDKRWLVILFASLFLLLAEPLGGLCVIAMGGFTFWVANRIFKEESHFYRKLWLSAGIGSCLSLLVLVRLGFGDAAYGSSFYIFQMVGYLIDVYQGMIPPEQNLFVYLTSVSSFFYISAGPILRAAEFIPQLRRPQFLTLIVAREAIFRICWGLAKKNIGDMLGLTVNEYFDSDLTRGPLRAWTAVLALSAQYYADFSGYSDIAIGLGQFFGLRLPENFRTPFLAKSVADHWRRWHISLSEWFRVYVFTPLCLARLTVPFWFDINLTSRVQIGLSVVVTMILAGLWHGFTWNNLIWGGYNAALIVAGAVLGTWAWVRSTRTKFLKIFVTFYLMMLGRVLTRTPSWKAFWAVFNDMHWAQGMSFYSSARISQLTLAILGITVPHLVDHFLLSQSPFFLHQRLLTLAIVLLILFNVIFVIPGQPFLYERF